MHKIVHIEGINQEITLRRNTRIKRLSIKIDVFSGIIVCVPYFMTDSMALKFVVKKANWIHQHLKQIEQKRNLSFDEKELKLVNKLISFRKTEHNIPSIIQKKESILVYIPDFWNSPNSTKYKKDIALLIMKREAEAFLPKRIAFLAERCNLRYNKLSLRNQKTLWGSCSYQNNISLNIQLMRLPLHLIDYVIIHELCHTVHKNHSQIFWKLVEQKLNCNMQKCKKELQKYTTQL